MLNHAYSESDLESWLSCAEEAARMGGQILNDWSTKFTVREKSVANLVTEADVASQQAIYEHIQKHCPAHGFIGEEGLNQPSDSGFNWIIDPLDGTGNYVHGFPYYAVSIGLAFHNTLLVGVIFDPTRNECYTARAGGGAFLNKVQIHVSKYSKLSDAFCIASLPQSRNQNNPALQRFLAVIAEAQTVQRTGSAALNLANIAAGRLDGFWSSSLYPWDMAAGALLVQEAGGRISSLNNSEFMVMERQILATNNQGFHQHLSDLLSAF